MITIHIYGHYIRTQQNDGVHEVLHCAKLVTTTMNKIYILDILREKTTRVNRECKCIALLQSIYGVTKLKLHKRVFIYSTHI